MLAEEQRCFAILFLLFPFTLYFHVMPRPEVTGRMHGKPPARKTFHDDREKGGACRCFTDTIVLYAARATCAGTPASPRRREKEAPRVVILLFAGEASYVVKPMSSLRARRVARQRQTARKRYVMPVFRDGRHSPTTTNFFFFFIRFTITRPDVAIDAAKIRLSDDDMADAQAECSFIADDDARVHPDDAAFHHVTSRVAPSVRQRDHPPPQNTLCLL